MSSTIKVTLTMNPDTARSVLSILEHALREGDQRLADKPDDFDQHAVDFHNSTKQALERQVINPIRDCFPPNVFGPGDLVGWKVTVIDGDPNVADIKGFVTSLDPKNTAQVIVRSGMSDYLVHWGLCHVVV